MKKILKQVAKKINSAMNRLGEDFNMLLLEDILPYPSDMTVCDPSDEELSV